MKCPSSVLLEDYAEGLLAGREAADLEAHLGGCGACRLALDERKRWLDAFGSLPPLDLPPEFARRVMEAAFPRPRRKLRLLPTLAAGLSSLAAVILVATGVCDLPALMTRSGSLLWRGLQEGSSLCAKAVRVILAFFKATAQLVRLGWDGIEALTSAASPQVQVLALMSLAVLAGFFFLGYRKYFVRR